MTALAERLDTETLPGTPGKALSSVWEQLSPLQRSALLPHVLGGTSADWLATELTSSGYPIGATAIKNYRRRLRQAGVQL